MLVIKVYTRKLFGVNPKFINEESEPCVIKKIIVLMAIKHQPSIGCRPPYFSAPIGIISIASHNLF